MNTYESTSVPENNIPIQDCSCRPQDETFASIMIDTNKCLREIIFTMIAIEEVLYGTNTNSEAPKEPENMKENARQNNQLAHCVLGAVQQLRREIG